MKCEGILVRGQTKKAHKDNWQRLSVFWGSDCASWKTSSSVFSSGNSSSSSSTVIKCTCLVNLHTLLCPGTHGSLHLKHFPLNQILSSAPALSVPSLLCIGGLGMLLPGWAPLEWYSSSWVRYVPHNSSCSLVWLHNFLHVHRHLPRFLVPEISEEIYVLLQPYSPSNCL